MEAMARSNDRDRGRRRATREAPRRGKPKVCIFCSDHIQVDWKDINLLRRFMSDRGKIKARRATGTCAQHQRRVAIAIKTARELALVPYTQRTVSDRGRGGGRSGGGRARMADTIEVTVPEVPEAAADEPAVTALVEADEGAA